MITKKFLVKYQLFLLNFNYYIYCPRNVNNYYYSIMFNDVTIYYYKIFKIS